MSDDDWWEKQLKEYEQDGRRDADKGIWSPPYPGSEAPDDEFQNEAYRLGFNDRRKELGKKFRWRQ